MQQRLKISELTKCMSHLENNLYAWRIKICVYQVSFYSRHLHIKPGRMAGTGGCNTFLMIKVSETIFGV